MLAFCCVVYAAISSYLALLFAPGARRSPDEFTCRWPLLQNGYGGAVNALRGARRIDSADREFVERSPR